MRDLLARLQRALFRHGVGDLAAAQQGTRIQASPAQLLSALYELEQDGMTLAPLLLPVELREQALAAARAAKESGDKEPVQAMWDVLTAHALPELRRQDQLRREVDARMRSAAEHIIA